jgi:hypothetical protein
MGKLPITHGHLGVCASFGSVTNRRTPVTLPFVCRRGEGEGWLYSERVDDHIQTLFGSSEEGYEPPPDPEPGDEAWGKLAWVIYPLIVVSAFTHGTLSEALNKVVWSLLVMGLLVTSEWSRLKKPRTLLLLTFAGVAHLCIMRLSYGLLPEHKRTLAVVFVSAMEAIILGLPIKILNLNQAK